MKQLSYLHKPMLNRNILITGGSGSQYAADILDRFLVEGANVHVLTRDIKNSEKKLLDKILIYKNQLRLYEVDYSNFESLEIAVSIAARKFGIDALINCAATAKIGRVEDVSMSDWNEVFHINVGIPLTLSKLAAPFLRESELGSILNISSIYGQRSPKHFIYGDSGLNSPLNYGASKAALEYMTKYLATYWAPQIRVNALVPGGFYAGQPKGFVSKYVDYVPMRRMAEKGDLGGAALFLCGQDAKYITGQCLLVDGGWTCW